VTGDPLLRDAPRRLRVLVVSHTYVTPENRRKLEAMARAVDVLALVPRQGVDLAGPQEVAACVRDGYELRPLPVRGDPAGVTRWRFRGAGRHWARFAPDVVLIEQEVWSHALLQALLLRRRHAPSSDLVVYAWESQRRAGWRGRLAPLFYRLVTRRASALLAGNRDARDLFVEYGADPSRVFVAAEVGLDPVRLCPADAGVRAELRRRHGFANGELVVGFAGRFQEQKGLLDLADAVAEVTRGGIAARLALIGDGPLRPELARRAAAGAPITLLPAVPREALAPFYQSIDVFVLPSRTTRLWKEQFGMVLAEAMACGVPVAGSSSGAIPDVIGDAGLVFAEGDPSALAAALRRLAADPGLRDRLGRLGRERSLRLFSHDALAEQTLRVIARARGGDGPPPDQYCAIR
jgi:glycosyltransferase involved in cell wall biosynthesis